MGLKAKGNKYVYQATQSSNSAAMSIFADNGHTFDFSSANNVGKVFMLVGNAHQDMISVQKSQYNEGGVEAYDGEAISQTAIDSNNNVPIPIIWTTCDAYGRQTDGGSYGEEYTPSRTINTITEQVFDLLTLKRGKISIKRFGAGLDRNVLFVE